MKHEINVTILCFYNVIEQFMNGKSRSGKKQYKIPSTRTVHFKIYFSKIQ